MGGRVLLEGVHAVDGDPAAHEVEAGGGLAQRRGGVGGVDEDLGVRGLERAAPTA